ncbi:MAG: serine/threonine protein kinase [Deltaproteobacteria bacterium]|nr:serine/threonine protein kinase [Deltaproteobacteria bacterium]
MHGLEQSLPRRFGRYLLLRPLGSGGMAEIYLGVTQGMGGFRKVFAIKCLHPHLMRDTNLVKLFMDEARVAARLNHSNIVQTFDLGEQDGSFYIAMEYIPGANLAQLLSKGCLPFDVALTLVTDTAAGLSFAHKALDEQGNPLAIVHRDVTPRNIMVSFTGEVKLTDFGIARAADQVHTTRTGESKGTLRYMSPEQLEGKKVDSRSDIYSLGVCLFETFTARRLFRGITNAKLHDPAIRLDLPQPSTINSDVPPAVDAIVSRALEPDVERRYATCAELWDALKAVGVSVGAEWNHDHIAEVMRSRFPEQSGLPLLSPEDSLVLQRFGEDNSATRTGPHQAAVPDPVDETSVVATKPEHTSPPARVFSSGEVSFSASGEYAEPTVGSFQSTGTQVVPPRRSPMLWVAPILLLMAGFALVIVVLFPKAASPPSAKPARVKTPPQPASVPTQVSLKIISAPAGALVMVDGVDVGRTPQTLKRPKDPARLLNVMLLLDGYVPVRRKVSLVGDTQIEVALSPKEQPKRRRRLRGRKVPRVKTRSPVIIYKRPPVVKKPPVKKPPVVKKPPRRTSPDPVKVDDLK